MGYAIALLLLGLVLWHKVEADNDFDYLKERFLDVEKRLKGIEKRLIHCENCGSTGFDDGWTAACPHCSKERKEGV